MPKAEKKTTDRRLKLDPRTPGFATVKAVVRRMEIERDGEKGERISVDDRDVPAWQRQTVWNDEEMGLLAVSILKNYPIGMIILWKTDKGIRVPIDGRQRLTAMRRFYTGEVSLPDLPWVPMEWRKKKYILTKEDLAKGFKPLSVVEREAFDDYQLKIIEYEGIDESTAMEIFVMLQGGKSLTKTEVRAALGGQVCDFVTELTSGPGVSDDDEEGDEPPPSKHEFFRLLSSNLQNRRKSHRNVADILLHEHLYPNTDKHWSSLEKMYREKSKSLSQQEKGAFRTALARFLKATSIKAGGKKAMMPQLRSAFFILSVYKAWSDLFENYDPPKAFSFSKAIGEFEVARAKNADELPWVSFTAALSNAGYAQNRIDERHDILMSFLLRRDEAIARKARDKKRTYSMEQKIAIWERAAHRCEWVDDNGARCKKVFDHPRKADADHVVMWKNNGPTSVENGRLLCQKHNRGRQD